MINSTSPSIEIVECSKNQPFCCRIKERYLLSKKGERTYHVVLDLQGKQLFFEPGDSIGVFPENDSDLVQEYLLALKKTGSERIIDKKTQQEISLETYLSARCNLTRTPSAFVKVIAAHAANPNQKKYLETLLQEEQKEALHAFLKGHEPLDLIGDYFAKDFSFNQPLLQELMEAFSPLLPRFYSIASSSLSYPSEIHLTVALSSHEHHGKLRKGVASHFLAKQAKLHTTPIPIFVQKAIHFHLPEDGSIPLIMVGPGTGVAPFKAFIEERVLKEAKGKMWLFFGERYEESDYFYKDFFLKQEKEGVLKLTTAFSRDQEHKIYVQHRLMQHQKTVWKWMQEGALFYVCGSASPMAKDVEAAFIKMIEEEGQMNELEARDYLRQLRKNHRYLSDVY